mgnify:FL=1
MTGLSRLWTTTETEHRYITSTSALCCRDIFQALFSMGRRKLNGTTFFQCDWTGYPMKWAHCYIPTQVNGKLAKKGSYCNWESVVAHMQHLGYDGDADEYARAHITSVCGSVPTPAPHYEVLAHTKGHLTAERFHEQCCSHDDPVSAVKISVSGDITEVSVENTVEEHMQMPFFEVPMQSFHSVRRKSGHDLRVFYYPTKDLAVNPTATNHFKMQLHGDVILVQQSREQSFMPRERYIDLTLAQYQEQFLSKKRKRVTPEAHSLGVPAYEELKAEMQGQLDQFEHKVSAKAIPPRDLSKAQTMARSCGYDLGRKMKERLQASQTGCA